MPKILTAALMIASALAGLSACSLPKSDNTAVADILSENEVGGEITVSCYDLPHYEDLIEQAALEFEKKFPGTKVVLDRELGFEMKIITNDDGEFVGIDRNEDPDARNIYISRVNTEIMGGRGADIYALDILPFNSYAELGQLENFREYMEYDPEFDITAYREEIFDALTDDRGQFVMPLNYYFDYFMYNEAVFNESEATALSALDSASFKTLIDMAKEAYDRQGDKADNIIGFWSEANMFQEFFKQNFYDFVDLRVKKSNFTDGRFAALLNEMRGLIDEGYVTVGSDSDGSANAWADAPEIEPPIQFFVFLYGSIGIYNFRDIASGRGAADFSGYTTGLCGIRANDCGEAAFTYSMAFGINANSKNKKTAWEFIKFMLSDEQWDVYRKIQGFQVNKNAFLRCAEQQAAGMQATDTGNPYVTPKTINEQTKAALDAYTSHVERYTARAKHLDPYSFDTYITNAALTEGFMPFMRGEKTAEEAAQAVQDKVNFYLSE